MGILSNPGIIAVEKGVVKSLANIIFPFAIAIVHLWPAICRRLADHGQKMILPHILEIQVTGILSKRIGIMVHPEPSLTVNIRDPSSPRRQFHHTGRIDINFMKEAVANVFRYGVVIFIGPDIPILKVTEQAGIGKEPDTAVPILVEIKDDICRQAVRHIIA